MFISDDLPAPFSPSSACTSPQRAAKWASVSAAKPSKDLRMPVSSSALGMASFGPCLLAGCLVGRLAYFCVTTPLTNQSIFHRSASDSTAPLATRSLPSRSASGPA
jgi:hypothetical protein